ncbi:SCP2 sterol-binding domain-containing protein [Pusillimonas sp. CC-YST705]|uniref:Ubiquinone biosynthesis accessory factor UbiJ n=1 Tax=Mesopusillimonas faecipullorum TaxID=2755040 RepID=A0ABS8CD57_9BURK|nr:SCP2 sterol-binding domain-containing protein [Mesopusillimonas faecipullorum]MCB5363534.1 SCP2 sterol-binding domain-containing protein [Mesopusillimonas faecipullorum]
MFPFPAFPAPALGAGLLNRMLRRQAWAQVHLQPHAGKTLRFQLAGKTLALRIQNDGLLRDVAANVPADAVFTLEASKMGEAIRILRTNQTSGLARVMHIEGEAALAQVVMDLAQNLRPDPEDELSRLVGDRAAVRLMGLARGLTQGLRHAGERLSGNVVEYLTEEDPVLLARAPFEDWQDELSALQQRLARLDASMAALERRNGGL